jgi:hypothetical protein
VNYFEYLREQYHGGLMYEAPQAMMEAGTYRPGVPITVLGSQSGDAFQRKKCDEK